MTTHWNSQECLATHQVMGVSDNTPETMEEAETATEAEVRNIEHNIAPNTDNELNVTGHN